MMLIRLLLLLSCMELCTAQFQYPSNCARPNTVQIDVSVTGPIPPIPRLPSTFQATVEVNMVDKEQTMVATEYKDGPNNRVAIKIRQYNTEKYLLLDYNYNQTLSITDGVCIVSNLSTDANSWFFGLETYRNGLADVFSTSGALHFANSNGMTYMGRTSVRGIKVDHWLLCLYWPVTGSNFTLDYYFSARTWTTPEGNHQIPIRAEVKGINTRFHTRNFHHSYEYIDFNPHIQKGDQAFQTPLGVICPGRKQVKTMPTMPNRFSYRGETVTPLSQQVTYMDVWYDYDRKLVRYDYRPASPLKPFFTTSPVTQIQDYSAGVAYAIDKTLGNCSVIPIPKTTLDDKSHSPKYLEMRSPLQWIYADNTSVSYEGQRTVRGQLCDVFVSNNTNLRLPYFDSFYSTFVYYFLSDSWVSPGRSNAVPVKIDITAPPSIGYQGSYEYYEASGDEFPLGTFDVSPCFDDSQQKHFRIDFPVAFNDSQLRNTSGLLRVLSHEVRAVTHLHEISLQNTELNVNAHKILFLGTILNKPPAKGTVRQKPSEMDFNLAWDRLGKSVRSGQLRVNVTINGKKETLVASSLTGLAVDGSVSTSGQLTPGENQTGPHFVG